MYSEREGSLPALQMPGSCTPFLGQIPSRGQESTFLRQVGVLAVQRYLPCRLRAWEKAVWHSSAKVALRQFSIAVGSFLGYKPSLKMTRITWVSTIIPGLPKHADATRLAVFLPTPGRLVSDSMLQGTIPANSRCRICAVATRCLAFVWKKPTE